LREGLWHPIHTNRANTTLMAANPADLVRGHGVSGSDAQLDAAAIERLETNKVKKLPDAGLSDISVKSQGGSSE
jgi:type IV pilus biogenesis protein CpaD/CtpE